MCADMAKSILGLELGSTRIKAVVIDEAHRPIASGEYAWESRYENGIWTYSLAVQPDEAGGKGFEGFVERYRLCLDAERAVAGLR